MIEINAARHACASVKVSSSAVSAKATSRHRHVRRSVMAVLRTLALATVLTGTALVGGCASQGEMGSMNSRMGELEQSVSALNQRLDAMASKDHMGAERAAKAAEEARQAAQAAAESSAKAEAAFRKSLRK
jgi:outer membrane murein-binding lipoprotein Lpp